jgi:glycosyltransferase involved in cell wall biosynthesis
MYQRGNAKCSRNGKKTATGPWLAPCGASGTDPPRPQALPRVCFVNSMRVLGGAEVWILDAALGLRQRGHAVSLVAQPGTPLLARARAAGLPATAMPIRFDGAPWTLLKLRRWFRRQEVEAVICNLTKDLKAAGVAARWAGIGTVLALRESDFPLKSKFYYRWYYNRIASGVVVNSRATLASTLAGAPWLDSRRVHLLYKGIDTERFRPAPRPPQRPTVGFLGQLIPRKGLAELKTAWELLEGEDWADPPRLQLAGEGPLAGEMAHWRAGLRRPQQVELLGFVERPESFLAGLSLLVMPSRAEGFGLAAAEAAACELPVVASRTSSLPEIVRDGETGLLVPCGDPVALAAALGRLLRDEPLATRLGRQGRKLIVREFSREHMLDGLQSLLKETGR